MNILQYERQILALDNIELEKLIRSWADSQKSLYCSVVRKAGAGDMGRDVVGYFTENKDEGNWVNYQCKQYAKALPTDQGMLEIGKILYYAFKEKFTVPIKYFFVAPRGVNKNLDEYISNPSKFKSELISSWDKYCKSKIIKNVEIPLSQDLLNFINTYNFSSINIIDIDYIVEDEKFRHILVNWFGGELLPAPEAKVPETIDESEKKYIEHILDAYGDRDNTTYNEVKDISGELVFDFEMQRERFYSAEAFKCFYRDNTVEGILKKFENEIFKGVYSTSIKTHNNAFECMCGVLEQAASIQPSGKLAIHAKIDVKQGYCHHFVNADKLKWRKK